MINVIHGRIDRETKIRKYKNLYSVKETASDEDEERKIFDKKFKP